ncbi:hypothetical protein, partial [Salmonella sp. gx-f7]|uniref:hypothetical protein n=1 Tax=Salmonella sp. gx-f7 TaxID=2582606 RepID=UPI001F270AB1
WWKIVIQIMMDPVCLSLWEEQFMRCICVSGREREKNRGADNNKERGEKCKRRNKEIKMRSRPRGFFQN